MKIRKARDVIAVLKKKGFFIGEGDGKPNHHTYYYLWIDGKKTAVYTYFSHKPGSDDLNNHIMKSIQKQLKFETDTNTAEKFFDCPFTKENYAEMIKQKGLF
jgi:predicted RNA binding protein YcfA (HicA-like mRNA interferase family)